ncbi:minor capsid protein 2 [Sediminihabitans luteus]|uniref:Minor capsid protein 2 n=1 Tax=Sediminihabitans luteus TaxID=1138585 RepID=A0A2M9CZW2_9CELL|nr:phage minor capsid protein [Sediminihabitans luteus]PJJ77484.1 minor capsid protein 2 [Sediminihabitans luteus]GII98380.1 hypothetical protein Slu03_07580 [Sediminihabitans luteus]
MPVDPGLGEFLAGRVSALYADAELRLLRIIRDSLARDLGAPAWAVLKLTELERVRAALGATLRPLTAQALDLVIETVAEAYEAGQGAAATELGAKTAATVAAPAQARAIATVAEETISTLIPLRARLLRSAVDVYQRTAAAPVAGVLAGADTTRTAAQTMLNRLVSQNVLGFTDKSGRRWALDSYVEMAVRTGTGKAAVQGHVDTLAANGLDLVVVSDAPRECPLCRPYEGKVLSTRSGRTGRVTVRSETSDEPVTVEVTATLNEARANGFQHPNCRHSLSAYVPGATRLREPRTDPDGYEAGQRQRAIERNIRKWKQREAVALDGPATAIARAKVREHQAVMRDHLADHPELRRLRHREQARGVTHTPAAGPSQAVDAEVRRLLRRS